MLLRDAIVHTVTMDPDTSTTHLFLHLEKENARPVAFAVFSLASTVKSLLEDNEHFLDDRQVALLLRDYHPSLRTYAKEHRPIVDDGFGLALGFLFSSDVCADVELDLETFTAPLSGFGFTIKQYAVDSRCIQETTQKASEQTPIYETAPQEDAATHDDYDNGEDVQNNEGLNEKDDGGHLLSGIPFLKAINTMETPLIEDLTKTCCPLLELRHLPGVIRPFAPRVASRFGVAIGSFFMRVFDRGKPIFFQHFRNSVKNSNCV